MIASKISEVIARRLALDTEDYINIQKCWDEETKILSHDIFQTINFIENECDDYTFCWIGEVFEDVAEITNCKDFILAIKKRAEKIIDEKIRRSVETDIYYAETKIY